MSFDISLNNPQEVIKTIIQKNMPDAKVFVVPSASKPNSFHVSILVTGRETESIMVTPVRDYQGKFIGLSAQMREGTQETIPSEIIFRRNIKVENDNSRIIVREENPAVVFANTITQFFKTQNNARGIGNFVQKAIQESSANGKPLSFDLVQNITDDKRRRLAQNVNITGLSNIFDKESIEAVQDFFANSGSYKGYVIQAGRGGVVASPVAHNNMMMVRKNAMKALKLVKNIPHKGTFIKRGSFLPTQLDENQSWGSELSKRGYLVGSMSHVGGTKSLPVISTIIAPVVHGSGAMGISEAGSGFLREYLGTPSVKRVKWSFDSQSLLNVFSKKETKFAAKNSLISPGAGKFAIAEIYNPYHKVSQPIFIKKRNAGQQVIGTTVVLPKYYKVGDDYGSEFLSYPEYNALDEEKKVSYIPIEESAYFGVLKKEAERKGVSISVSETVARPVFEFSTAVQNDFSSKGLGVKAGLMPIAAPAVLHDVKIDDGSSFRAHAVTSEVKSQSIATHAAVMSMPKNIGEQFLRDIGLNDAADEYREFLASGGSSKASIKFLDPTSNLEFWQNVFDRTQELDEEKNKKFLLSYGFGRTTSETSIPIGNVSKEYYEETIKYIARTRNKSGSQEEYKKRIEEAKSIFRLRKTSEEDGLYNMRQIIPAGAPVIPIANSIVEEYPAFGTRVGIEQKIAGMRLKGIVSPRSYKTSAASVGKLQLLAARNLNSYLSQEKIAVPSKYKIIERDELIRLGEAYIGKKADIVSENPEMTYYEQMKAAYDAAFREAGIEQGEYGYYIEPLGRFVPNIEAVSKLGVSIDRPLSKGTRESDVTHIQDAMARMYEGLLQYATNQYFISERGEDVSRFGLFSSEEFFSGYASLYKKFDKFLKKGDNVRDKSVRALTSDIQMNFGGRYMHAPGIGGGNIYIPTNMLRRIAKHYGLRGEQIKEFVRNARGENAIVGFSRYPNIDVTTSVIPLRSITQSKLKSVTGYSRKQINRINESYGQVLIDASVSDFQQGDADADPYTIFSSYFEKISEIIKSNSAAGKITEENRAKIKEEISKIAVDSGQITVKEIFEKLVRSNMNAFSPIVSSFGDAISVIENGYGKVLSGGRASETDAFELAEAGENYRDTMMRRSDQYDAPKRFFAAAFSSIGRNAMDLFSENSVFNQFIVQAGYQKSLETGKAAAVRSFFTQAISSSKLHYLDNGDGTHSLRLNLGYMRPPIDEEEARKLKEANYREQNWFQISYNSIGGLTEDSENVPTTFSTTSPGKFLAKQAIRYFSHKNVMGKKRKYQAAELLGQTFGYDEASINQIKSAVLKYFDAPVSERGILWDEETKGINFDKSPVMAAVWNETATKFIQRAPEEYGFGTEEHWESVLTRIAPESMSFALGSAYETEEDRKVNERIKSAYAPRNYHSNRAKMQATMGVYRLVRNSLTGNALRIEDVMRTFLNPYAGQIILKGINNSNEYVINAAEMARAHGLLPGKRKVENKQILSLSNALLAGPEYLSARDIAYGATNSKYYAQNVMDRVFSLYESVFGEPKGKIFGGVYEYSSGTKEAFNLGNAVEQFYVKNLMLGFGSTGGTENILQAKFGKTTISGIPDFFAPRFTENEEDDYFFINEAKVGSSQRESGKYQVRIYAEMMRRLANGSSEERQYLFDYLKKRYIQGFELASNPNKNLPFLPKGITFDDFRKNPEHVAEVLAKKSIELIRAGRIHPDYVEFDKSGRPVVNETQKIDDEFSRELERNIKETREAIGRVAANSRLSFIKQIAGGGLISISLDKEKQKLVAREYDGNDNLRFSKLSLPEKFKRFFGIPVRDIGGVSGESAIISSGEKVYETGYVHSKTDSKTQEAELLLEMRKILKGIFERNKTDVKVAQNLLSLESAMRSVPVAHEFFARAHKDIGIKGEPGVDSFIKIVSEAQSGNSKAANWLSANRRAILSLLKRFDVAGQRIPLGNNAISMLQKMNGMSVEDARNYLSRIIRSASAGGELFSLSVSSQYARQYYGDSESRTMPEIHKQNLLAARQSYEVRIAEGGLDESAYQDLINRQRLLNEPKIKAKAALSSLRDIFPQIGLGEDHQRNLDLLKSFDTSQLNKEEEKFFYDRYKEYQSQILSIIQKTKSLSSTTPGKKSSKTQQTQQVAPKQKSSKKQQKQEKVSHFAQSGIKDDIDFIKGITQPRKDDETVFNELINQVSSEFFEGRNITQSEAFSGLYENLNSNNIENVRAARAILRRNTRAINVAASRARNVARLKLTPEEDLSGEDRNLSRKITQEDIERVNVIANLRRQSQDTGRDNFDVEAKAKAIIANMSELEKEFGNFAQSTKLVSKEMIEEHERIKSRVSQNERLAKLSSLIGEEFDASQASKLDYRKGIVKKAFSYIESRKAADDEMSYEDIAQVGKVLQEVIEDEKDIAVKEKNKHKRGIGSIAREMFGGFGLMYIGNILGQISSSLDFGKAEYEKQAKIYDATLGKFGSSIYVDPKTIIENKKARGYNQTSFENLYASLPAPAMSLIDSVGSGLFATAGSVWLGGILANSSVPLLASAGAALTGGLSLAIGAAVMGSTAAYGAYKDSETINDDIMQIYFNNDNWRGNFFENISASLSRGFSYFPNPDKSYKNENQVKGLLDVLVAEGAIDENGKIVDINKANTVIDRLSNNSGNRQFYEDVFKSLIQFNQGDSTIPVEAALTSTAYLRSYNLRTNEETYRKTQELFARGGSDIAQDFPVISAMAHGENIFNSPSASIAYESWINLGTDIERQQEIEREKLSLNLLPGARGKVFSKNGLVDERYREDFDTTRYRDLFISSNNVAYLQSLYSGSEFTPKTFSDKELTDEEIQAQTEKTGEAELFMKNIFASARRFSIFGNKMQNYFRIKGDIVENYEENLLDFSKFQERENFASRFYMPLFLRGDTKTPSIIQSLFQSGGQSGFDALKRLYSGDERYLNRLINANPSLGYMTLPGVGGSAIPFRNFALTDVNLQNQLTGAAWGTNSIILPGMSAAESAIAIFGRDTSAFNSGLINAITNGYKTPYGTFGGQRGANAYIADLQYGWQIKSAGIQSAQNRLGYVFQTGVGLDAYSGVINPQTGQPFNFNTGKFSFNVMGTKYTSQGGGMWGLDDAQRNLGYAKQEFQFEIQRKQLDLSRKNFFEDFALSLKQANMQRGWARQDWGYQDQMRNLQWAWTNEDYAEQIRFLSGRDRRLAERKMRRETIVHNIEGERIGVERGRQQEIWKLEDKRFETQKKQFEESAKLQEEQFAASKKFFEEERKLNEQSVAMQRAYYVEQHNLQQASIGIALEQAKQMKEVSLTMEALKTFAEDAENSVKLLNEDGLSEMYRIITEQLYPSLNDITPSLESFSNAIERLLNILNSKESPTLPESPPNTYDSSQSGSYPPISLRIDIGGEKIAEQVINIVEKDIRIKL